MKVRITGPARQDLIEIGDWIAQDNPLRAASFVAELLETCGATGTRPRGYPVVRTYPEGEIRKATYRHYLILYRIRASGIEILRIVHASRDWASLFAGEP